MSSLVSRSKGFARHIVDRTMLPYFETLRDEVATRPEIAVAPPSDEAASESDTTSDLFHHVLHELRTLELERIPRGAKRVLSVGASGRWYFDWFERHVGVVDEHIGVEAFEPEPVDLPAYATWIDSTADRFDGVESSSMDLVFAGQTTEHLWPDELVGFLTESNRVLNDGGLLVADSPNRLVTEHLRWTHGGHTVELSEGEISELLALAGFEVESSRGAWLCRIGDRVLELEDGIEEGAVLARRIALGGDDPDSSFIWWVTARRSGEPDVAALTSRVHELFDEHWSTRVSRGMWPGPGSDGPAVAPGATGMVVSSLPMFLHPGRWSLSVTLDEGSWDDVDGFVVDITAPGSHLITRLVGSEADRDGSTLTWEFEQETLILALSIEFHLRSVRSPVRFQMPLRLASA